MKKITTLLLAATIGMTSILPMNVYAKKVEKVEKVSYEVEADEKDTITKSFVMEKAMTIKQVEKNIAIKEGMKEEAKEAKTDIKLYEINGVTMISLRAMAEALDYTVKWNNERRTVEIYKGAQWTEVAIGKNQYIKNKMAPMALSAAPLIKEGRTFVPIEFLTIILSKGIEIEKENITILEEEEMAIHEGYVQEITYNDKGEMSVIIAPDKEAKDIYETTILHVGKEDTFMQVEVEKGLWIQAICPPVMTMSLPGQTFAYIIY